MKDLEHSFVKKKRTLRVSVCKIELYIGQVRENLCLTFAWRRLHVQT